MWLVRSRFLSSFSQSPPPPSSPSHSFPLSFLLLFLTVGTRRDFLCQELQGNECGISTRASLLPPLCLFTLFSILTHLYLPQIFMLRYGLIAFVVMSSEHSFVPGSEQYEYFFLPFSLFSSPFLISLIMHLMLGSLNPPSHQSIAERHHG